MSEKIKFRHPETGQIHEGTYHGVRGVFDPLKPKTAIVEMQFITDAGAVSVHAQMDYADTWTDPEALQFANEYLQTIIVEQ